MESPHPKREDLHPVFQLVNISFATLFLPAASLVHGSIAGPLDSIYPGKPKFSRGGLALTGNEQARSTVVDSLQSPALLFV